MPHVSHYMLGTACHCWVLSVQEFKGSIRNQTLMGHLLLLVDRGNITQDKLLSLYGLGTNPGVAQAML
jgi:hypothetical protein